MKNIEDFLEMKKAEMNQIEVPSALEGRLRTALNNKKRFAPRIRLKGFAAAVSLLLIMLLAINYDAIAFYGKQLLGYDYVMNGSLKQLSELGKGQPVGKRFTFPDGVSLAVDYVMLDENQLLLFYTVTDPSGHVDEDNLSPFMSINAFWGEHIQQNSQGVMNEAKTEIKYIGSFAPPKLFEKKLTLQFSETGQGSVVPGEISFSLNRNTAMGHTLKKTLHETYEVDKTSIRIDSILASPTKTVISGSIQNIFQLAMDQLSGERIRPGELTLRLIANGKEVTEQGGGMSTDMKGITFHCDFDPLPQDLNKLQLELVKFGADHDVNERFALMKTKGGEKQTLTILEQKVEINTIETSPTETRITISSEDSLILSRVYLNIDGQRVSLEQTTTDQYDKRNDGTVIHTRTLHFSGTGDTLELDVQRMTYSKDYNKTLEIPVS
ncbi:DUF4179 domain-containing protein [Dehalobacter sp. DCM]|uniref:DUF4179 domain-containing protein n=1 Tax=Dehalobacter sp. DCM TaxID=2907827 RepID=UPI0030820BEC|nr:DUF4179 domain-containing protein [Dehalobacter sp. DCM]